MNYSELSNGELLAELDDIIQFKLVKANNIEWAKQTPELVEFRKIKEEIRKRMEGLNNGN